MREMMGLFDFLKPKYEVEAETYYSEFLQREDGDNLRDFVERLGSSLTTTHVAILAVGESTFPRKYWKAIEKHNKRNPEEQLPASYEDIQLNIVPERPTPYFALENHFVEKLAGLNVPHQKKNSARPHFDVSYDPRSELMKARFEVRNSPYWTAQLDNGREVQLFLGDVSTGSEDFIDVTAGLRIRLERAANSSFSLLYIKDPKISYRGIPFLRVGAT